MFEPVASCQGMGEGGLRGFCRVELAKAWLQIAKKKFTEGMDNSVLEALFESMKASGRALYFATSQNTLPLILIAECAILASELNKDTLFKVPAYFIDENEGLEKIMEVNLLEMLSVGLRALSSGLTIGASPTLSSSLEVKMAKLYFLLHIKCGSGNPQNALHHAKRAVLLDPNSFSNWNTLGVITTLLGNNKLAQHSFIKSINLNPTGNVAAWCNLGLVYLCSGEIMQAHRCFTQGQSCEPTFGYSWIGQGLVAEILAPHEAMDLFRHACLLEDTHAFASLCYSDWVCKTLESERTADYLYNIEHLEAVDTSLEKFWLYNVRTPTATSLNLQGILQAHAYLVKSAKESFRKSLKLADDAKLVDSIKLNLTSTVLELKDYSGVLELVGSLPKQVFRSTAAAAQVLEKTGESLKAFEMYETLKTLCTTNSQNSDVLIAQGIVAFSLYGIEEAKTLLFQACQLSDTPAGYFALAALSLMNNELDLTGAVLAELSLKCKSQKYLPDLAILESFYLVSQGLTEQALRSIVSRVHSHPHLGKLRTVLASHLINFCSNGAWARSSLLSASYLGEEMDYTGIAITYLLDGDTENAFKFARQAVHIDRKSGAAWAVFVSSLYARANMNGVAEDLNHSYLHAQACLANLEWKEGDAIKDWLQNFVDSFSN